MQPHAMDGLRKALERWPSPVEGDGLENRYGSLAHREFKSLPLRSTRVRLGSAPSSRLGSPGWKTITIAVDWGTVFIWAVIIAVPLGLVVVGTWWQLRVTRWVAGRTSRIDEEKLPPEVKRRVATLRRLLGVKPRADADGSRNQ